MKGHEESVARCDAAFAHMMNAVGKFLPEYGERALRYGFRRAWEIRDDEGRSKADSSDALVPRENENDEVQVIFFPKGEPRGTMVRFEHVSAAALRSLGAKEREPLSPEQRNLIAFCIASANIADADRTMLRDLLLDAHGAG